MCIIAAAVFGGMLIRKGVGSLFRNLDGTDGLPLGAKEVAALGESRSGLL